MRLAGYRRRTHRLVVGVLATTCLLVAGCGRYTPSYDRNDHVNGGLVSAIHSFADNLSSGRAAPILLFQTAWTFEAAMERFVAGHLGHPARVISVKPSGDQLVSAHLAITCGAGNIQHVDVLWSWRNGGWRGWPGSELSASGRFHDYPACQQG